MTFVITALLLLTLVVAIVGTIFMLEGADHGDVPKGFVPVGVGLLIFFAVCVLVFVFCGIRWFFFLR
jgi:hypothetical protein